MPAMMRALAGGILNNFEGLFVLFTLVVIGVILYFIDQKISFLNFFFLPVLIAGYFMNTRSALLGALLSIAWVTFFIVLDPLSFSQEMSGMGIYMHILIWGCFLILTGVMVGKLNEQLHARYQNACQNLDQLSDLQRLLSESNKRLEEKQTALEVTKERVKSVLYATMDPYVAKLIIDRRLRDEKRPLTVLFADLADFTKMTEDRPPESVIEDLNALFSAMDPILARFKGHLDKFLGDGLMAEFGTPYAARNHPLLAVLAALRMQARVGNRQFPFKMRIGIASGPALIGLLGSENRKNYTAVGDTVNLAARLQALCPVGGVCVNEETYSFIRRWFHIRQIRSGLSHEEVRNLEARLEFLADAVEHAPTAKLCLEAANVCSELGDMHRALRYHRQAMELDPSQRQPIERAVAAALLTGEDRRFVTVKGKKERVAAYEVIALKDPLQDRVGLPAGAIEIYNRFSAEVGLPVESVMSIEALEGTLGHSQVAAALSAATADAMGLDERQVRAAFMAGYFHDLGKRNVPEHLLQCEDQLQRLPLPDQTLIKAHVREAEKVLAELQIPAGPEVIEAIQQHHERFDGSGYPQGLKDGQICLLARVLHIADTYESLTSWRPHQEAWTPAAALMDIERSAREGLFDPRIGEVFLNVMKEVR